MDGPIFEHIWTPLSEQSKIKLEGAHVGGSMVGGRFVEEIESMCDILLTYIVTCMNISRIKELLKKTKDFKCLIICMHGEGMPTLVQVLLKARGMSFRN